MTTTTAANQPSVPACPRVADLTLDHPWQWVEAGWKDMRRAPGTSIAFGVLAVVSSYLVTLAVVSAGMFFLVPPLAAGFFLLAPLFGMVFYAVSRGLERGVVLSFGQALMAWRTNHAHIAAMGIVLLLLMLVWMLIANLVFAIFYGGLPPMWDNFIAEVFLSGKSPAFLLTGIITGAILAFAVFTVSVVSIPMLMDRQVDVMTAIRTSFAAVRCNPRTMLLWACIIVMLIGAGFATFFLGLAVALPLVGHATWHAYRDTVPSTE